MESDRATITLSPAQTLSNVLYAVLAERKRQDMQWGGPAHDDTHSAWDWADYIRKQADLAEQPVAQPPGQFRERMVKIAALAFAAIESHDRVAGMPPLSDLDMEAASSIAAAPQAGPNLDTTWRSIPEDKAAAIDSAVDRLLDAAHTASELMDGCPDDDVMAAASTELSEAALAVSEAQAQAMR